METALGVTPLQIPILLQIADIQFHVKCVNISGALPDTWYCPDCVQTLGLASSDGNKKDRKGRKK